jgi:hypothetical protein
VNWCALLRHRPVEFQGTLFSDKRFRDITFEGDIIESEEGRRP